LCALVGKCAANVAVTTREYCFYNRFGQLFIASRPAVAGYDVPQLSIHRATCKWRCSMRLYRVGSDKVITGWRCTRRADGPDAVAHFEDVNGKPPRSARRRQRGRNPPRGSASNFIRMKGRQVFRDQHVAGVTRWKPFRPAPA
jgi:hypothetical protein